MAVLTTDKVTAQKWTDLNTDTVTLVNMRGNWSVEFLKDKLPKSKVLLVEANADTVRSIAQGRADALVENVDFFMAYTKNYPDIKWRVLSDAIFTNYDSIGVAKGNDGLRQFLNTLLFDLHSSEYINTTWTKWYGAPMLKPVTPNPFF
jgi:polar amino acid transport system substrate-binding protein